MKFKSNATKGVFVGFSIESNCYVIMDYTDHSIHLVREAVFDKHTPSAIFSNFENNNLLTNIFNNDNYIYESPIINIEDSSDIYNDSNTIYIENSDNSNNNINDENNNNKSKSENNNYIENKNQVYLSFENPDNDINKTTHNQNSF
ncbi:hypothetical protein PIROE2DRAFT_1232, partial [Piromyces sp. E2]